MPAAPPTSFVLMLKAPRPGTVKTRLAAEVGDLAALDIYGRLVAWQLAQLQALGPGVRPEIHYTPEDGAADLPGWIGLHCWEQWHHEPQCGEDLGERLVHAMASAFSRGAGRVVFLGGDCPFATAPVLEEAGWELGNQDIVLGPALDGGYYLIGLRGNYPEVFRNIDWGTERVFAQTMERIRKAGLIFHLLPEARDVDTLADWEASLEALPDMRAMLPDL